MMALQEHWLTVRLYKIPSRAILYYSQRNLLFIFITFFYCTLIMLLSLENGTNKIHHFFTIIFYRLLLVIF